MIEIVDLVLYLPGLALYAILIGYAFGTLGLTRKVKFPVIRVLARSFLTLIIVMSLLFVGLNVDLIVRHETFQPPPGFDVFRVLLDWINACADLIFVGAIRIYLLWSSEPCRFLDDGACPHRAHLRP